MPPEPVEGPFNTLMAPDDGEPAVTVVTTTGTPVGKPTGVKVLASPAWRRRNLTFDRVSFFLVFLVVPVVGYLTFVVSPFLQAAYFSLTSWTGFSPQIPFVGLVRGLRYSSVYRVISFVPYVVPAIVIGLIWASVYDPNSGLLNGALTALGLDQFSAFAWLGDVRTARYAVMFAIVWGLIGFYMVLFIAAIKGVPAEIYEAARVDGAGRFRTAVSVTIPLIRDNVQTAYIYMGILALDAFVYVAALAPGGGPENSTLVISQQLFTTAFTKGQFGYACAMGVVLAIITLAYAGLIFAVNRLTGGTNEVGE
jgi:N-acetylglucosamine transport system permease protein